jgi:hypothetical protein
MFSIAVSMLLAVTVRTEGGPRLVWGNCCGQGRGYGVMGTYWEVARTRGFRVWRDLVFKLARGSILLRNQRISHL